MMASASRPPKALSDGGYDHDFVDPTHAYECPLCLLVAREPVQTECGHTFCEGCWERHLDSSGEVVLCPIDNQIAYIFRVFKDAKTKRTIGDLKVRCDHRQHGCTSTSELRYLQDHMAKCEYQPVPCGLCGANIPKVTLDTHTSGQCPKRQVPCTKCGDEICAQDLQAHEADCLMVNVGCEWCHGDLWRKDIAIHQARCLERPTYCSFALQGCSERVIRRGLKAHHEANVCHHMELLNSTVMDINNSLGAGVVTMADGDLLSTLQYELPSALCGQVNQASADHKMTASGDMPKSPETPKQMTIYDKVLNLESKFTFLSGVTSNMQLEVDALTIENTELRERLAVPQVNNAQLEEQLKELKRQSKAELDGKMNGFIELQRRAKAELDDKMKEVQQQSKDLDKKLKETDERNKKISRGEIVEGGYYSLPVYWSAKLDKKVLKRSPAFYTTDGYRMCFETEWSARQSKFVVGPGLEMGENDGRVGMWPWCGADMTLTVRVQGSDMVYEEEGVVPVGNPARERTHEEHGNRYALISVNLEGHHEQKVIHLTLKRKMESEGTNTIRVPGIPPIFLRK